MSESPSDVVLVVSEMNVLVERQGEQTSLCSRELAAIAGNQPIFVGSFAGRDYYAAQARPGVDLPVQASFASARSLFSVLSEPELHIVGRALACVEFEDTTRYCGRCATPTELLLPEQVSRQLRVGERARSCPRCGFCFYPRIPPAVIVLVEDGERILLGRSARFAPGMFSALAGFVEIGESLEEAARREVREEVGIELAELRYFASQPWPFGRSLMVGFFARYAGGELRPDGVEIEAAEWFERDRLPVLPPRLSIARKMIESYLSRSKVPR